MKPSKEEIKLVGFKNNFLCGREHTQSSAHHKCCFTIRMLQISASQIDSCRDKSVMTIQIQYNRRKSNDSISESVSVFRSVMNC